MNQLTHLKYQRTLVLIGSRRKNTSALKTEFLADFVNREHFVSSCGEKSVHPSDHTWSSAFWETTTGSLHLKTVCGLFVSDVRSLCRKERTGSQQVTNTLMSRCDTTAGAEINKHLTCSIIHSHDGILLIEQRLPLFH